MAPPCATTVLSAEMLDRLISPVFLRPEYQPIVDLRTGSTVGYEALARWPGLDVGPTEVFAEAARAARMTELDRACQIAELGGALDAGLDKSLTLFVNGEPGTFATPPDQPFHEMVRRSAGRFRVIMEITERRLLHNPAELFRAVRRIRERGWGIALDDVGAVPESLALLPFIAPDVIKLDLPLVQHWPTTEQGRIVTAVMAHAERTGATLLAEGIETEAHLEQAMAFGATLGQGWYYSAAGPLGATWSGGQPIPFLHRVPAPPTSPFQLVESGPLRIGRKGLLLGISRHLENQGLAMEVPPVVLAVFQDAAHFTPASHRRYGELALRCPLVVAFGQDLEPEPAPGVWGARLGAADPLCGEWTVVIVGTHYAGALIAHDLGDTGPDRERRFEFKVTHDRDIVLQAARSVIERIETPVDVP